MKSMHRSKALFLVAVFMLLSTIGYSQFTGPQNINVCVPPGPNNNYPDAAIQVPGYQVSGNINLTDIRHQNVERDPNHPMLSPNGTTFIGPTGTLGSGAWILSLHPVHDPGPTGRTGTVTLEFGNQAFVITVNITRCGNTPPPPTPTRPNSRKSCTTLQTYFNRRTGRMEVIKSGVYSSRGFKSSLPYTRKGIFSMRALYPNTKTYSRRTLRQYR